MLGREEAEGGIPQHHGAPRHHIRQESMGVKRVPEGRMENVPGISKIAPGPVHSRRRHHEGHPGIRQKQQHRSEHIQDDPQRSMEPLAGPCAHPLPGIIIQVERRALRQKDQRVDPHHCFEHTRDVAKESGIQGNERHDQRDAED